MRLNAYVWSVLRNPETIGVLYVAALVTLAAVMLVLS